MKVTQKPRGAFTVTEYAAVLRQAKVLRNHVFVWNKPDTRFHIKPLYRSMPLGDELADSLHGLHVFAPRRHSAAEKQAH
jgi:hypothetical protein